MGDAEVAYRVRNLFFDYKKDLKLLTSLFGSVQEKPGSMIDGAYKMLVLSEPKK